LRSISDYLKGHATNVAAFYISNVELDLDKRQLQAFYATIAALPQDASSILMRFVNQG